MRVLQQEELEKFMWEAIREGRKALPECAPNPPVGCVIVKEGQIIARGHTGVPGAHHAEAMALEQLPKDCEGFTIFVTLEPCSFVGRTPSCARAIVKTKADAVYVGIIDPDPRNNGAGIEILKQAGIPVYVGLLADQIQQELGPYLLISTPK